MAKLRKMNTSMKELYHKDSYSIPSYQTLSHLRHHPSRTQLIPISPFYQANLLDCVNLSFRSQILPSISDLVTSLKSELVILLISAASPRLGPVNHLPKISIAHSMISLWIISHHLIRISPPWIPFSRCLPSPIYCSKSLSLINLPSDLKAQAYVSFQSRTLQEAARGLQEPGAPLSSVVISGFPFYQEFIISNWFLVVLSLYPLFRSSTTSTFCCFPSILFHPLRISVPISAGRYPIFRNQKNSIKRGSPCTQARLPPNQSRYNFCPSQVFWSLTSLAVHSLSDIAEPSEIRPQNENQTGSNPPENPLDRVLGNNTCTLCKQHCFMIARIIKRHNELKEDYQADSRSKRKKLEKQRAEIESLKEKCTHLEEAIAHIKNITDAMQAEASTRASKKDTQMEDSVNQFW